MEVLLEKLTKQKTSKKLYKLLKGIFVSEYYIENILLILGNDINKKELINFLNTGETDTDRILLRTAEITRKRKLL